MARISKDRLERRQELIDAAERLFLERGYDQTAVSDLVREIDVAQGTFYYYFDSKEEVLEAVIDGNVSAMEEDVRRTAEAGGSDSAAVLNSVINCILDNLASKEEFLKRIHLVGNAVLHDRLLKRTIERLTPPLTEVVSAGTASGRFDVTYPEEAAEFLVSSLIYIFHEPDLAADPGHIERMRDVIEMALARMLGTQDFRFSLDL